MIAREVSFLKKRPLPRAPSRKDVGGGDSGGEAASLREAPLPQTPSPEEWLAFELCASAGLVPPEGGGGLRCINIRNGRKMRLL